MGMGWGYINEIIKQISTYIKPLQHNIKPKEPRLKKGVYIVHRWILVRERREVSKEMKKKKIEDWQFIGIEAWNHMPQS